MVLPLFLTLFYTKVGKIIQITRLSDRTATGHTLDDSRAL